MRERAPGQVQRSNTCTIRYPDAVIITGTGPFFSCGLPIGAKVKWCASLSCTVPFAVFARPGTSSRVLAGIAAHRFARARVAVLAARRLALMAPPAWVFFHTRLDPRSATSLRAERLLRSLMEKKSEVTPEAITITPAIAPAPTAREQRGEPDDDEASKQR